MRLMSRAASSIFSAAAPSPSSSPAPNSPSSSSEPLSSAPFSSRPAPAAAASPRRASSVFSASSGSVVGGMKPAFMIQSTSFGNSSSRPSHVPGVPRPSSAISIISMRRNVMTRSSCRSSVGDRLRMAKLKTLAADWKPRMAARCTDIASQHSARMRRATTSRSRFPRSSRARTSAAFASLAVTIRSRPLTSMTNSWRSSFSRSGTFSLRVNRSLSR
mmetsp:Transcript_162892/g.395730  ORF Transcript_162892/g.395730 Transcript_162892/m.395730 type:complete len:217 (-) Transcript_162892:42-692(-)